MKPAIITVMGPLAPNKIKGRDIEGFDEPEVKTEGERRAKPDEEDQEDSE